MPQPGRQSRQSTSFKPVISQPLSCGMLHSFAHKAVENLVPIEDDPLEEQVVPPMLDEQAEAWFGFFDDSCEQRHELCVVSVVDLVDSSLGDPAPTAL
jgi:hypothetical protein